MDEKSIQLLEDALVEWRTTQTRNRESVSLNKFAEYLGVSRPQVSMWLNGDRAITQKSKMEIAKPLAALLGNRVYVQFNVPIPDPDLERLNRIWEKIPPADRRRIAEQAEKYVVNNEGKKRSSSNPASEAI